MSINYDVSYLTIDSIQEGVGSSQIIPLVKGLAKQDCKVKLITFEKLLPSNELIQELKESQVSWTYLKFGRNGALGGLHRLYKLSHEIPPSRVLHGRSDLPTCAGAAKYLQTPILWDVRSIWVNQRKLTANKGWNRSTIAAASKLEDFCALRSSGMTTLTNKIVPILEQKHSRLPKIRDVIPTSVDTYKFALSSMPRGQKTCLISGTINKYYDVDKLVEVITYLRQNYNVRFIWAKPIESDNQNLHKHVDMVLSLTHNQMPEIIKKSHFGICILKNEDPEGLAAAMPTKIAEFFSCGKPVWLSQGIGDFDYILQNHNIGVTIGKTESNKSAASRIFDLINDRETPERCRNAALELFSMESAISKYLKIYDKITLEGNHGKNS